MDNILLVEGSDDKYAIASLLDKYKLTNSLNKATGKYAPVDIKDCGGFPGIYEVLKGSIKNPVTIGVIVDADNEFAKRWTELRNLSIKEFPDIVDEFPKDGLIVGNKYGGRFGIWIMPNNALEGNLETFAKTMIPEGNKNWLLLHAKNSTKAAREEGAGYKDKDIEKAEICTWLAWQEEPAQSIGTAIIKSFLKPENSPYADNFVKWFKDLFKI